VVLYTGTVTFFFFFLFFSFFFSRIAPRPYRLTDFRAKTLKRRGLAQGGAFWGSQFKIFEIWGAYPKSAQKGAWLGIFSANKSIAFFDAIFACVDRLPQIKQEHVEKLCTYFNCQKIRNFQNPRWRRPPSWIY